MQSSKPKKSILKKAKPLEQDISFNELPRNEEAKESKEKQPGREDNKEKRISTSKGNGTMRQKYSELLSVKRELVLPLHYKQLIELQSYLDNSLLFLK